MSSSLRRGTLAATALTLSVLTLSACGAGNDAQTGQVRPDNAAATVGDVKVQNVNIVTAPDGSGPATVTGRVFNDGDKDQELQDLAVGSVKAKLSPAKGEKKLVVPAGGSLALGGADNAAAELPDAKKAGVADGNAQPVTFDLSSTGPVKLRASVVPANHQWEKVGPSGVPSQGSSPSGKPSEKPSGKPSESAGQGESASPGADASQQAGGEHAGH
ncbi:DUF461 domain-containing protein [Streptomyces sp. ODS28]|uniref:DUF461 domain-containing protein n=1 Tax=Streptomyces sp. ODS28 TaxID=3136688 RepID=UPI0031EBCF34